LCENDEVEYIEPDLVFSVPTTITDPSDTTTAVVPDDVDIGSGTSVTVVPPSSIVKPDIEEGSGPDVSTVYPDTTAKCNKIEEYEDKKETTYRRYTVILNTTSRTFKKSLIDDLMAKCSNPDNAMKANVTSALEYITTMFIAEMNIKAMEYVSQNSWLYICNMQ